MSKCIYTQEQYDKIIQERNKLANDNFKLNLKLVENIKENQRLKDFIYKRENCNEWLTIKDNENLQYEIKQLKQQLAEKNADLHQIYSHLGVEAFGEDIHEQALKEIRRLLEEIAKKDKQLRTKIGNMKSTDFIMMCLECGFWIDAKEKDNQDKISFCIEQLEKLRKHYCHLMWDGRSASDSWVIQECVDLLDKELKQLTHQHEDKGE